MKLSPLFCCPQHHLPLALPAGQNGASLPLAGEISCSQGCRFRIENGIPRVVPDESYTSSFGLEWNRYPRIFFNGAAPLSLERLERCSGMPLSVLKGMDVLEAGCGSGRFTGHLLAAGARVCALDLSSAVEASYRNHGEQTGYCLAQADLLRAPYRKRAFDVVFCLGVLQHTPSPEHAIAALAEHAKVGGLVVLDHYAWSLRRVMALRYLYRLFIKRMEVERAHRLCRRLVDLWFPLHQWAGDRVWLYGTLSRVSPIVTYFHRFNLTPDEQRSLAYLDTFDFLTPRYEHLRTVSQVRRAMLRAGLGDVEVWRGGNGVEARGRVRG
jgi:SAM-dependent methyltransferase